MVMLVTLDQASDHIRRDTTDDDNDLTIKIEAASEAVLNYIDDHTFLDSTGFPETDSAGQILGVPKPIQQAVLLIVGMLYSDRDGAAFSENSGSNSSNARLGQVILPKTCHFLLDPYRLPTLA